MNISIDFDDTYTRDPQFWNNFIYLAQASGHKVYCVTARGEEYECEEDMQVKPTIGQLVGQDSCIFTNGMQKRQFCLDRGIKIHVWIDDMPEAIASFFGG